MTNANQQTTMIGGWIQKNSPFFQKNISSTRCKNSER